MTDDEKRDLLKCIRFSYLEHKELLAIFNDPLFTLAKDYVFFINITMKIR